MKALFLIPAFSLILASCLAAESVTPADIRAGKLVPGSVSPDKKHCLLEVFHDGTTQNSVIFAPSDRSANLGYAPLSTVWSTDIPYPKRAIIHWSPDSNLIALHDSLNKHSAVDIYRRGDLEYATLTLPDLLDEACRRWKINRTTLASSGQRPLQWKGNDELSVTVTAKRKTGEKLSTTLHLKVPKAGPVEIIKR